MKNLFVAILVFVLCGCAGSSGDQTSKPQPVTVKPAGDDRGVGEIKEVTLNNPLNQEMVARGQAIYDMKCSACHKTTGQRVVGPGFSGVTERRKPEWIMNMITNTDAMLEKDPQAQALLEECLTRMPNQNVSMTDARDVLEFLLNNDQSK